MQKTLYVKKVLSGNTIQLNKEIKIKDGVISNARLAMGGVAHKPWRLMAAETFLKGKQASTVNFETAAKLAVKHAKGFGENDFKLKLAPNTIIEALTLAKSKA